MQTQDRLGAKTLRDRFLEFYEHIVPFQDARGTVHEVTAATLIAVLVEQVGGSLTGSEDPVIERRLLAQPGAVVPVPGRIRFRRRHRIRSPAPVLRTALAGAGVLNAEPGDSRASGAE